MNDRVEIPWRSLNDRRVKGSHLRVLATLARAGEGATALSALSGDCGVQVRELRRLIQELASYGYVLATERPGQESEYRVLFDDEPRMKNTPAENDSRAEKYFHETSVEPLPPDVPPSLSPVPPKPFPPLTPPSRSNEARASRLPAEWRPSANGLVYAEQQGIAEVEPVIEDFRDYWHARAGPEARKVDWDKTWQRWVRTAAERLRSKNGRFSKPSADSKTRDIFAGLAGALVARGVDCGPGRPRDDRADFSGDDGHGPVIDAVRS